MKRTQLQLDEDTYQLLRTKAIDQGLTVSAMMRRILDQYLKASKTAPPRLKDFIFIGSGSSAPSDLDPISERHDEAMDQHITLGPSQT